MYRKREPAKARGNERGEWLEKLRFLSDAMELTSQPFAAGDTDGALLIFNEAYCSLTGYSREELYTLNWMTDLTTPESRQHERDVLKRLNSVCNPQRYEKSYIRKDGIVIPIELLTHVAADSRGKPLFYYSFVTDVSERRRMEDGLRNDRDMLESKVYERMAALSRNEECMCRLIETSPIPVAIFDAGNKLSINKKFVETFGYTSEDLPTMDHWWPLAYPDREYREFVKRRWETEIWPEITDRVDTKTIEAIVTCKDGSRKHVLVHISSAGYLNLLVVYDITGPGRVEKALDRYKLFSENTRDIVLFVRRDGCLLEANEAAIKAYGYTREELLSLTIYDLRADDQDSRVDMQMDTAFEKGILFEAFHSRKDGSMFPVEVSSQGRLIGGQKVLLSVVRDITERKRAEEALLESDAMLAKSQEMAHIGSWVWDVATSEKHRTAESYRILGMDPGEYMIDFEKFLSFIVPEDREYVTVQTRLSVRSGRPFDIMYRIRRKDGAIRVLHSFGEPVTDPEGRVVKVYGTNQDVTERMLAEEELKSAKHQAELYLDLMGHDISNMHQIVMIQLELALSVLDEEGHLGKEDRELITTSLATLDRSANLINNVRMLQKVRSGEYRAEPLDLGRTIGDAVQMYSDLPGRNITIKFTPPNGRIVKVSPLIKDIVANLLDNAVKHSPDPVEIGIDVGCIDDQGKPYYSISVEDNGIGIPDDKKDLIFQRFKRGNTAAKGIGLGLYIVRTLVEGFGGSVRVEDRVHGDHARGARFVILLPAAEN